MSERVLTEILAAHADRIVGGAQAKEAEVLALFPDYQEELDPLMDTARQVREALVRVQPSDSFRARLREEIITRAGCRMAGTRRTQKLRWRQSWVVAVAALGSVISVASAVGVIAHLRRVRGTKPASATG